MNQSTIRIVKKYYSKTEAIRDASYFRTKAKKENRNVKVEVINAYSFYVSNSYIKTRTKLGIPKQNEFIIIIKNIITNAAPIMKAESPVGPAIQKTPTLSKTQKHKATIVKFMVPVYSYNALKPKRYYNNVVSIGSPQLSTNTVAFSSYKPLPAA